MFKGDNKMNKILVVVLVIIALFAGAMFGKPATKAFADGGDTQVENCLLFPLGQKLCLFDAETIAVEDANQAEETDTGEVEETQAEIDTYRGYRIDFPERSIGRVIVEETLIEGPALHQDRDGNVTVIRKNASATFTSGIVWLYKVGDSNSVEDEIIFLENQIKFFNDPNPLWIETD